MGDPRLPGARFTPFELDCLLELEDQSISNTSSTNSLPNEEHEFPSPEIFPVGGPPNGLWDSFETCAYSVAKLYRSPNWNTFQLAAASATQLYKDSIESNKRGVEQGMSLGRQKLVKEMLGYLRCSKRSNAFVRREDLLGILAGRSPPSRHHQQSGGMNSPLLRTLDQLRLQSSPTHHRHAPGEECREGCTPALYMFHEALAPSTDAPVSGGGSPTRSSPPRRASQELSSFLMDEVRRHRKRRHDSSNPPHHSHSQGLNRSPMSAHSGKRRRTKFSDAQ